MCSRVRCGPRWVADVATTYSGAWAKRRQDPIAVPLKAAVDPEHLNPTDDPGVPPGQSLLWQEAGPAAPTLPTELTDAAPGPQTAPGGPLVAPGDPMVGMGGGAGLTVQEAQAVRSYWHGQDDGSVAAHAWEPNTDRWDGSGPHVAIIPDMIGDGDSPQTLQLQRTGVGQPNDPGARLASRIKRWWDRYIDMHRFPVEYRPLAARYARTPGSVAPVPDGNQLDSPFPTVSTAGLLTRDQLVYPQTRRTPAPWDEPMTSDGVQLGASFGLGSWGL